jgi:hypothetical protein
MADGTGLIRRNKNESNKREDCVDLEVDADEALAMKESQCQVPFYCVITGAFRRGSDHLGSAAGLEAN